MNLYVIRNQRQLNDFKEQLSSKRLPLKIMIDDIYPNRSLDMNAYYFGVVLKYISDESGHTVIECHDAYKEKFNLSIDFIQSKKTGILEPILGIGSTAIMDIKRFNDYVFRVRADGEIEHHIIIPLPSECFIPELEFENNKIKHKRL